MNKEQSENLLKILIQTRNCELSVNEAFDQIENKIWEICKQNVKVE